MSDVPQKCPKYEGEMIQGFVADFADMGQNANVATWVEGPPETSLLYGTKTPTARRVPIGTFRCAACGYLESYARPEFDRQ